MGAHKQLHTICQAVTMLGRSTVLHCSKEATRIKSNVYFLDLVYLELTYFG